MTNESTNEPAIRKGMTCDELYYYRRFRQCGMSFILLFFGLMLCGVFALVSLVYQSAVGVIGCGCLAVFLVFVMSVKFCDAERYYKRAFPNGEPSETKL